jgi:ParB family chromosome partitioning protein
MAYESNSIFWVEVEKIVPNPFQPRREFDEAKLRELGESIRMYGLLQPLTVTRREIISDDGSFTSEYELIAGERRLRASKLVGLSQVPIIIRSGEESELMKLELAIIENLQREDLNPVDRAQAFKQLSEKFGLSHVEVAKKVGRSREYVSNSIRLLGLPETILSALRASDISDGHGRTLLMLNDRPEEQDTVFRETLLKKLSVREVERIARKIATDRVRKKVWVDTDPELMAIEKQFTESLGTRVQILKTDYGGKVTIDYFSPEDLQKLLSVINSERASESSRAVEDVISELNDATPLEMSEVSEPLDETPITDSTKDVYTRHDGIEAPVSNENPEPEEDDTDLYSIKNFSL